MESQQIVEFKSTGGTFTVTAYGLTGGPLAYDAATEAVNQELERLFALRVELDRLIAYLVRLMLLCKGFRVPA